MSEIDINANVPGYGDNPIVVKNHLWYDCSFGKVKTQCESRYSIAPVKDYLKNKKDGIFVEFGVFGGATLLGIYETCKANNIKIYGIDPFENINIFNGASEEDTNKDIALLAREDARDRKNNLLEIIEQHKLDINIIQKESWQAYQEFENNSITCIHVDGDHSHEGVKKDLNLFWKKIKSGGMILNDDYYWESCAKAINEFVSDNKHDIVIGEKQFPSKHLMFKK